ncbi:MAG: hypothetical protein QOF59_1815 [Actinomycetota bacterium]|jgi:hypothetical protein|nr:hypothetical protein [Actinomycetota bacterium]
MAARARTGTFRKSTRGTPGIARRSRRGPVAAASAVLRLAAIGATLPLLGRLTSSRRPATKS